MLSNKNNRTKEINKSNKMLMNTTLIWNEKILEHIPIESAF